MKNNPDKRTGDKRTETREPEAGAFYGLLKNPDFPVKLKGV